jgi:conjugal transfer pilus assembly protein TraW
MKALNLLFILNLLAFSAIAKDFGVEGHIYEIAEEDILKFIEKKLSEVDLEKLNHEMKTKTSNYVERPKTVSGITNAKKDKVLYYDPTYVLQNDIRDHEGKLIHKAGSKVNPLSHIHLREDLIFIDGDNKDQIELALKLREDKQGKAKIILIKGYPLALQKKYKLWIYFDQAGVITKKLGIREIPAIVEQEGLKLRITIIGSKHE